jgi:uncharacterized protein YndB with AHSA1/START domain
MRDEQLTFFEDGKPAPGKPVRFQLRRSFTAGLETVFDAWLIPFKAGDWMFGPRDSMQEVITLENQPLPGGKFRFEVCRDGQNRCLVGEYLEIRRPEKLICKIGADDAAAQLTTLTMELNEEQGKTRMKLAFQLDPSLATEVDTLRAQWTARCKSLAELVERSRNQAALFK